ncbi:MAG: putative transcriptional regulator with an HTH domain [Candidatus Alkanophagales archaeon MCA70_species_1]|nr:putative transcriptional regulator with an HTH domain [Candidatus Alkanophaga volatiphilum]
MGIAEELITDIFQQDKELHVVLSDVLKNKLRINIAKFSECAGVPQSTLYKILSGEREPNMKTFIKIVKAIRRIEEEKSGKKRRFIAVIAARSVLDGIEMRSVEVDGERLDIKEYPATSIEDAIISAVRAEREGAAALVCAPILSPVVEKILQIPIITIKPKSSVINAIKAAARKATG